MKTLNEMFISRDNHRCPFCDKDMSEAVKDWFKDELSWKEFTISGLCQGCQDRFFGE